ncbi:MAG: hypothetical protein V1792_09405 [Pseudomonadota bacterium]
MYRRSIRSCRGDSHCAGRKIRIESLILVRGDRSGPLLLSGGSSLRLRLYLDGDGLGCGLRSLGLWCGVLCLRRRGLRLLIALPLRVIALLRLSGALLNLWILIALLRLSGALLSRRILVGLSVAVVLRGAISLGICRRLGWLSAWSRVSPIVLRAVEGVGLSSPEPHAGRAEDGVQKALAARRAGKGCEKNHQNHSCSFHFILPSAEEALLGKMNR